MRTSFALFFLCFALLAPNLLADEGFSSRSWFDVALQPLAQIGHWLSEMFSSLAEFGTESTPDGAGPMIIPDGAGPMIIPDGAGPMIIPDGAGPMIIPDGAGPMIIPDGAQRTNIPNG